MTNQNTEDVAKLLKTKQGGARILAEAFVSTIYNTNPPDKAVEIVNNLIKALEEELEELKSK